jgi:hypothetical protein
MGFVAWSSVTADSNLPSRRFSNKTTGRTKTIPINMGITEQVLAPSPVSRAGGFVLMSPETRAC